MPIFSTLSSAQASRPRVVTAATLSAAIFALAHGYGAAGFGSVFASGLLWAIAYERTGSLLPNTAAHVLNNVAAALGVLLLLRG